MTYCLQRLTALPITTAVLLSLPLFEARAAPPVEVAKKCLNYAYRAYPYKRPGAAKASNGRQLYFTDCLSKNGDVAEPSPVGRQTANDGKPTN
jgi:hypothetical protein